MRCDSLIFVERFAYLGDADSVAFMRDRMARWLRSGGDLSINQSLGVPSTGPAFRLAWRDFWLCAAAELLPVPPRQRPARLWADLDRFMRTRWPLICRNEHVFGASKFHDALFRAAKAAQLDPLNMPLLVKMPKTRQQIANILRG